MAFEQKTTIKKKGIELLFTCGGMARGGFVVYTTLLHAGTLLSAYFALLLFVPFVGAFSKPRYHVCVIDLLIFRFVYSNRLHGDRKNASLSFLP